MQKLLISCLNGLNPILSSKFCGNIKMLKFCAKVAILMAVFPCETVEVNHQIFGLEKFMDFSLS